MHSVVQLIWIVSALWGAGSTADEVQLLRRNAEELLRLGQPAKALVLLQKAREMDSLQVDIDHMMNLCRARLGGWVAPEAGADWNEPEEAYLGSVRRNPDSMFHVAKRLAGSENIPGALKVLRALVGGKTPRPEHMKAYLELKSRQDDLVVFHRELAARALARGALSEMLRERRIALALKPDDPALRAEVGKAEQAVAVSAGAFAAGMRQAIARKDAGAALALAARARIAHPTDSVFVAWEDSLLAVRRAFVDDRLAEIERLFVTGGVFEAARSMESLGESFPDDPGIALAREALDERIRRARRKNAIDSVASLFSAAMAQGDLEGAEALVERMKVLGATGEELARAAARIDSVRAGERRAAQFAQSFGSARRALARKDTASAREWLSKALRIQPGSSVAKALLASLSSADKAPAPAKPVEAAPTQPSDVVAAKVNGLVMSGISAYRSGDYAKAMVRWKEALAIDPGCVQASRYLENVGRKQARLR